VVIGGAGLLLRNHLMKGGSSIDQLPEDENFYKSQKIYFELIKSLSLVFPENIKICINGRANEKDFRAALDKYNIDSKIEIFSQAPTNKSQQFDVAVAQQNWNDFEHDACSVILNTFLFLPSGPSEQSAIDKKLDRFVQAGIPVLTSASETSLKKNPEGQDLSFFSPSNSAHSFNFAVVGSKGVLKTTANSGDTSEFTLYKLNHGEDYYTTGLYAALLTVLIQRDIKNKKPDLYGANLVNKTRQVIRAATTITPLYQFSYDVIFSNQIGFGIVDYFLLDEILNKDLNKIEEVYLSRMQYQDFAPVLLLNNQCPIEKIYGFTLKCDEKTMSGGLPKDEETSTDIVASKYGNFHLNLTQNSKNKALLTIQNPAGQSDFTQCAGNKKFKSIDVNVRLNCSGMMKNKIYHLDLVKAEENEG